jgi:hypothetical protein
MNIPLEVNMRQEKSSPTLELPITTRSPKRVQPTSRSATAPLLNKANSGSAQRATQHRQTFPKVPSHSSPVKLVTKDRENRFSTITTWSGLIAKEKAMDTGANPETNTNGQEPASPAVVMEEEPNKHDERRVKAGIAKGFIE